MKRKYVLPLTLALFFIILAAHKPLEAAAQQSPIKPSLKAATLKDGSHDFDFEFGTWTTQLKRLKNPLSGDTTWVAYQGTTTVTKVLDGRANLVELDVKGPTGHIEALSMRLYNPGSRLWSLNFAGVNDGAFSVPTIGSFKNGRGEFYDHETFRGKPVLVRFVISGITPNSCRFEQAFSIDEGKTWEVNWIAIDTRIAAKN